MRTLWCVVPLTIGWPVEADRKWISWKDTGRLFADELEARRWAGEQDWDDYEIIRVERPCSPAWHD